LHLAARELIATVSLYIAEDERRSTRFLRESARFRAILRTEMCVRLTAAARRRLDARLPRIRNAFS
jgi:hypothetical protein